MAVTRRQFMKVSAAGLAASSVGALGFIEAGEDIVGLLDDSSIQGLTPAKIQAAARQYLDVANYARFVLLPELKTAVP